MICESANFSGHLVSWGVGVGVETMARRGEAGDSPIKATQRGNPARQASETTQRDASHWSDDSETEAVRRRDADESMNHPL